MSKLKEEDGTIKVLRRCGVPITRATYLLLAFAGKPPKEIDGEYAEELIELGISSILPDAKVKQ